MQPGQFKPPGDEAWMVRELQNLRRDIQQLAAANPFAAMGIAPKEGGIDVAGFINSLREDGTISLAMDDDGAFIVYNAAEEPVARFGELVNSNPGEYGVEILYLGSWVQVGSGNVDWTNISNVPATFTPAAHTHAGGDVTSAVAEAAQADGNTTAAFNRDVTGLVGSYKAVYMHSTNVFGYNTSDERYKKNIRDLAIRPEQLLALRAVMYDRKATGADDYTPAVHVDELGLIAGEVDAAIPQLALRFDGEIDSVFYERLGVVLLPFVQEHQRVITEQAADIAALKQAVRDLGGNV
jgi:hypothetical protein